MASPLETISMGRANTCPVRKSPILLGSWRNKKILEKQKMMRMSLKKLRKIGDPENLLHRAVLINNTLDYVRKSESIENAGSACKMNTYDHSNYSPEEEQILNSIRLPVPITPISDAHDVTEDNNENKDNGGNNSDVECLLRTLPDTVNDTTKYETSTNNQISGRKDQNCQSYISSICDAQDITEKNNENKDNDSDMKCLQSDANEKLENNFMKAKNFISKQQVFSKKVLKISLLYDCGNSNSYLVAF